MYPMRRIGWHISEFMHAIVVYFRYIGHIAYLCVEIASGQESIVWINILRTVFTSGARLVIPFMLLSSLMGMSLALNTHYLLSRYNLEHEALILVQTTLTHDLVPLLIGLVLCVQSALNLINVPSKNMHQNQHTVLTNYIFPIMLGINFTAMLLYAYVIVAFFLGVYSAFYFVLDISTHEYLVRLTDSVSLFGILNSLLKTCLYASIASVVVGYYYYKYALYDVSLRHAVSRIISRGIFWLLFISFYFKLLNL